MEPVLLELDSGEEIALTFEPAPVVELTFQPAPQIALTLEARPALNLTLPEPTVVNLQFSTPQITIVMPGVGLQGPPGPRGATFLGGYPSLVNLPIIDEINVRTGDFALVQDTSTVYQIKP